MSFFGGNGDNICEVWRGLYAQSQFGNLEAHGHVKKAEVIHCDGLGGHLDGRDLPEPANLQV